MSPAPYRDRAIGTRHMVSSGHHLATTTAFQILEAGGNAIDAAIAANAMQGLTEPASCGVGGDLFASRNSNAALRFDLRRESAAEWTLRTGEPPPAGLV